MVFKIFSVIFVILLLGFAVDIVIGNTLIFGRGGDSVGLDPAHEEDGESFKVCENIYDTLVQYAEDSTDIQPALAESWETSADGLIWRFHLRRGIKFHDDTDFNAEAVLFSLNRQHQSQHPFHKVGGPYIYWTDSGLAKVVDQISAEDTYTIRIVLKSPYAPFIYALAMPSFSIVSPVAARKWREDFTNHPVGTGAFKFVRWDRNDKVVLQANQDYWAGRPKIDQLIFRSIPDNSVRLLELQNGSIQAMEFPNPDDLVIIRSDPNLRVIEQPGMNVGYLAMNFDKVPFNNRQVRLAINHAINKSDIIGQLYQGMGIPAKNPIPPTMWSYDETTTDYSYDPELSKKLLAAAGYANGFETELWALPVPRPYIPDGNALAVAIQSDLRHVGIETKIVTYDWGTYLEKTKNGDHTMAMLGWSADFADPDNFFYYLLSKNSARKPAGNIAFYRSEEMQEILDQARSTTDLATRTKLYKRAQLVFNRDLPWVPLAHAKQMLIIHKSVKNVKLHSTTFKYFRRISLG